MSFDPKRPFADKRFLSDLYRKLRIRTKLYGTLKWKVLEISKEGVEVDLNLGGFHFTELDTQAMSRAMLAVNGKWGTDITYCLYTSSALPGKMLLNIRAPGAPKLLTTNIKFD